MALSFCTLKVVLVLIALKHPSAHGVVYYVAPTVADCPVNVSCNTLNYYANSTTLQLTDSAFYFTPGTHLLQQIWIIENASHLTLDQLFLPITELEEQKVVYIDCGGISGRGIRVRNGRNVIVKNLQIVHCQLSEGYSCYLSPAMDFNLVNNLTLSVLTITNSKSSCLRLQDCSDCVITDSVFAYTNC